MSRLLIVDDEPDIRNLLQIGLERDGHTVSVAANGKQALVHLRGHGTDLLLVDLFMPEMDGLELIMAVRGEWPRMPVVAMSGGGSKQVDLLRVAKGLGAVTTISKPVSLKNLRQLVREALES